MAVRPGSSRQPAGIAREKRTVAAMVRIYCADHHAGADGVCAACGELLQYAHQRLDRCPYGDDKPACSQCPIHCYQPARRERMREVMRHAGPKMLLRHPWLAIVHLWKERIRRKPAGPPPRRTSAPTPDGAPDRARRAAPIRID